MEGGRCGADQVLLALAGEILGPGLQRRLEGAVLRIAVGVEPDLPLAVEHPGHGIGRAQIAAVAAEGVADLRHGAVGIVGRCLDDHGGAAGAVALVDHFLEGDALQLAGALLDGAFDVVARHINCLGGIDGRAQSGVAAGVAAAGLGSHGDFPDVLGPVGSPARVGDRLLVLDLLPLAVAGHGGPPPLIRVKNSRRPPERQRDCGLTMPRPAASLLPPMPNLTTRRWLPALVAVALLAGACRPDQPAKTARLQDALPGMPLPNDPTFISRSGSDSALQIVLSSGQPPEAMINFYRGILSTAPWTLVSDQPFDSGGR